MKRWKLIAVPVLAAALLAGCDGASLKTIIAGLIAREQLGLIEEITISSAGDTLKMGEAPMEINQTLTYDFTISKYEITNAQYAVFFAAGGYTTQSYWTTNGWSYIVVFPIFAPSFWYDPVFNKADQPVVGVSWYEAVAFCNWRSIKESLTPAYDSTGKIVSGANGYRLPTEVEWEYAAAKGAPAATERRYAYGDAYDPAKQVDSLGPPAPVTTASVGSKSPQGDTREGVSDMCGNVVEWCSDSEDWLPLVIGTDRYSFLSDTAATASFQVRGGSWMSTQAETTASYRSNRFVYQRDNSVGFRVVRRP